ncbi:hypothetical protein [Candidatus Spongiihabitans sp.]
MYARVSAANAATLDLRLPARMTAERAVLKHRWKGTKRAMN